MFQFVWFALYDYVFIAELTVSLRLGLPHSEISGLKPVCGYPEHIAAYRVLHRLT